MTADKPKSDNSRFYVFGLGKVALAKLLLDGSSVVRLRCGLSLGYSQIIKPINNSYSIIRMFLIAKE